MICLDDGFGRYTDDGIDALYLRFQRASQATSKQEKKQAEMSAQHQKFAV